jgi:hypothetical protein
MKVFVKKQGEGERWLELEDIKEISIDLESGGQIDLLQTDSKTLRATMTDGAKLNIETA